MGKKFIYTCPNCNLEFTSRRPPESPKAPTYCSAECYRKHRKKLHPPQLYHRICECCEKQFTNARKEARFCSLQCLGKSRREDEFRTCETCGQAFYVRPCRSAQYCSRECYENRPRDGIWKTCEICGQDFYVLPSHIEGRRFCSRECYFKYQGPSSIEQMLIDELERRSIPFEFQYYIKQWAADFAFPQCKLIVEADGVYWHSLPGATERDGRKDSFFEKHGLFIIIITY